MRDLLSVRRDTPVVYISRSPLTLLTRVHHVAPSQQGRLMPRNRGRSRRTRRAPRIESFSSRLEVARAPSEQVCSFNFSADAGRMARSGLQF